MSSLPTQPNSSEFARRRLDRLVLQVCESVGAFIEWWGFKAIHGRVWTLLALHREPLSQAEIARQLGVSRALLSSAIHELQDFGLVRPLDAGRNSPWQAVLDVWPVIGKVLRHREWAMVQVTKAALEAAIEEADLAEASGEVVAYDVRRMRMLLALTETAHVTLRLLVALRVHKSMEYLGESLGRASTILRVLRLK